MFYWFCTASWFHCYLLQSNHLLNFLMQSFLCQMDQMSCIFGECYISLHLCNFPIHKILTASFISMPLVSPPRLFIKRNIVFSFVKSTQISVQQLSERQTQWNSFFLNCLCNQRKSYSNRSIVCRYNLVLLA